MESFKIELFNKDKPNEQFPDFRHLSKDEELVLQEKLFTRFRFDADRDLKDLVDAIRLIARPIGKVDCERFDLLQTIKAQNIDCEDKIFVNWYQFDDVDEFRVSDLSRCFFDIWYPSSDDIEIFDSTCSWQLSVRHDGVVSLSMPPRWLLDREPT